MMTRAMNNLFKHPEGIEVGQTWVNKELEKSDRPDPMTEIVVVEIDEAGMVHIASSCFGSGPQDKCLTPNKFRETYRLREE